MKLASGIIAGREEALVVSHRGFLAVSELAARYGGSSAGQVWTMDRILTDGPGVLDDLRSWQHKAERDGHGPVKTDQALAPVPRPGKILCVGLNYRPHAIESHLEIPQHPVLFSKYRNAVVGDAATVTAPNGSHFDYEAELVVVMGRHCADVTEEEALEYVLGYCNGNDLSARDLQFRTGQWLLGKALPGFGPMGPWLSTADDVPDPDALDISGARNGTVVQRSNTREMIFSTRYLISYVSRYMPLEPGDVIFTGTPEGVIMGKPDGEKNWLTSGETVTVSVEGLGTLTTHIG